MATPEQYGATGNGVDDDAPALVRAVEATPEGGVLELRAGAVYLLNSPLQITRRLTFAGKAQLLTGPGVSPSQPTKRGTPTLRFFADGTGLRDFTIRGLMRLNLPSDAVLDPAVYVAGRSQAERLRGAVVAGVVFVDCEVGLRLTVAAACIVHGCRFDSPIREGSDFRGAYAGVELQDCEGVDVTVNRFDGSACGVLLASTERATVAGNTIRSVCNNGVYVSSGERCAIHSNTIEGFDDAGIKTHGSWHSVTGNLIVRERQTIRESQFPIGIMAYPDRRGRGEGLRITGNVVRGSVIWGIKTLGVQRPVVKGNTVQRHGADVLVE